MRMSVVERAEERDEQRLRVRALWRVRGIGEREDAGVRWGAEDRPELVGKVSVRRTDRRGTAGFVHGLARYHRDSGGPAAPPEDSMANQFVVQLKNEPGSLAVLSEALAARGVDLRAIGGGGLGGAGHVIMTTADDDATRAILDDGEYTYFEGESILAEVDDRPGGMARISRELADAGVNIYGHLFLGRWGDRAMFAFVVDDPGAARPILERKG